MTESGFRPTGTPDLAVAKSHNDFAMLEPREQLATLLKAVSYTHLTLPTIA